MSERPSTKPVLDQLRWEPDAGNQAEPIIGKKDDGWPLNALVPSKELNWMWAKRYEYLVWLASVAIREYSTLEEGIAASSSPDIFRVHSPAAALLARGATIFERQGSAGPTNLTHLVAGDGQLIYYGQGGAVYGANPADGTDAAAWTVNPYNPATAGNVSCLAADGRYVYAIFVYSATGGDHEIHTLNPLTGALLASQDQQGSTTYTRARANGAYFVAISGSSIMIYAVGAVGVLTYSNTYAHGAALYAIGLDDLYAYIGGDQGTGSFDVRKIRLSTAATTWSVELPVDTAPVISAIWTDGDLIYVGMEANTETESSADCSLMALNPLDGSMVWFWGGGNDVSYLSGDDRWLYVTDNTETTYVFDKWSGQRIWLIASTRTMHADGVSLIGSDGGTDLRRVARGDGTRFMQRVEGDDPNRRPDFNLAIPVAQGSGQ